MDLHLLGAYLAVKDDAWNSNFKLQSIKFIGLVMLWLSFFTWGHVFGHLSFLNK